MTIVSSIVDSEENMGGQDWEGGHNKMERKNIGLAEDPRREKMPFVKLAAWCTALSIGVVLAFVLIQTSRKEGSSQMTKTIPGMDKLCAMDATIFCKSPDCKKLLEKSQRHQSCVAKLFQYHHGVSCDKLSAIKSLQIVSCQDFEPLPKYSMSQSAVAEGGDEAYMVVSDVDEIETVFFQGWVSDRGYFKIQDPKGFSVSRHRVRLYSSHKLSQKTLAQELLIDADCDKFQSLPLPEASMVQGKLSTTASIRERFSHESVQMVGTALNPNLETGDEHFQLRLVVRIAGLGPDQRLGDVRVESPLKSMSILSATHENGQDEVGYISSTSPEVIDLAWELPAMMRSEVLSLAPFSILVETFSLDDNYPCVMSKQFSWEDLKM